MSSFPPEQQSLPLSTSSYAYRQAHKNNNGNVVELSVNDRQNEKENGSNVNQEGQEEEEERRAVVNPSEMSSNSQPDAFYRPRHQENTPPTVDEVSNPAQSSSSSSPRPIQKKSRASKRRSEEFVIDPRYRDFYSIESMDTKQVTQALTFKINVLKLSQNAIAEKVLERSQGTLSDILTKPKPWAKLRTGHDTYRRLYMFLKLSDQEMKRIMVMSVDEVQQMMNFPPIMKVQKGEKETNESPKIKRIVFTKLEKRTLESVYMQTPFPNRQLMTLISNHMNLSLEIVGNWFMNRRRRANLAQYRTSVTPSNEPSNGILNNP